MRAAVFLTAILFATHAAASDDQQTCANSKAPPSDRIIACSAVLDSTPMTNAQMGRIFLYRSVARLEAGDAVSGLADATAVLDLGAGKSVTIRAHLLIAVVDLYLGRVDAARSDAELALLLDPNTPRAYWLRGIAEARANDHRAAEVDFTAAIDHGLPGADVWQRRSVERTALGDAAGAAADLAQAKATDPHPGDKPPLEIP